jgi:hypothetical protein
MHDCTYISSIELDLPHWHVYTNVCTWMQSNSTNQPIDKTEPVNETPKQAAPTFIVGTEYIKPNTKR